VSFGNLFNMMDQAKNSINVYTTALNVHSSNIANMSVNGYKKLDISFQSILDSLIHGGSPASLFANLGGTNPMQMGQGVGIANTSIDFSQGTFVSSNIPTDLAITGRGLFVVSNDGGVTYQYTRKGSFLIDANGNLVTDTGMQVYGLNSGGSITAITGLTGALADYSWDNGTGTLLYQGASTGFRIALSYFPNSSGLAQATATTFVQTLASGDPFTPIATGGAAGTVSSGQQEISNVVYTDESIAMSELQRALNAQLSVLKIAEDTFSNFLSKIG